MRPVVIINPAAGARDRAAATARSALARDVFRDAGDDAHIVFTEGPGHATRLAEHARREGASVVVAWGGDGTVNEVASALIFGDTPLAIVSAGSGNGFARELGIPFDARKALETAARGTERIVDVGELSGRYFVNVAGVGFDALVVERINSRRKGRGGVVRYTIGSLREFVAYQAPTYDVFIGGTSMPRRALLIAIANGRQYGHGALIAPDARLDDGQLDVVVAEPRSLWRGLADARRLFDGTIAQAAGISTHRVTEVRIAAPHPCHAHVDGEPFTAEGPLIARVHPRALRVRT